MALNFGCNVALVRATHKQGPQQGALANKEGESAECKYQQSAAVLKFVGYKVTVSGHPQTGALVRGTGKQGVTAQNANIKSQHCCRLAPPILFALCACGLSVDVT